MLSPACTPARNTLGLRSPGQASSVSSGRPAPLSSSLRRITSSRAISRPSSGDSPAFSGRADRSLRVHYSTIGAVERTGPEDTNTGASIEFDFDNVSIPDQTIIKITGRNEPGLLLTTTSVFTSLEINVIEATIATDPDGRVRDVFRVQRDGARIPEAEFPHIRARILEVVGGSSKSLAPAIYGAVASAEVRRLAAQEIAQVDADDTSNLELAAAELAAAAGNLVAVERAILSSPSDATGQRQVPDALLGDREEATAVLERKMAAIEALMKSRKAVNTREAEPERHGGGAEYRFAAGGGTSTGPAAGNGEEIILQAFNWESYRDQWYQKLRSHIPEWVSDGITAVWLPPPTDSVSNQGYLPRDLYNLNSKYGNEGDLRELLRDLRDNRIISVADIVINHRCATFQDEKGRWNRFGGRLQWDESYICANGKQFGGTGSWKPQEDYAAAPNVDHSQERVRKDLVKWLQHLRQIGFEGWRFDFVKGYDGKYSREYVDGSAPVMAFGEYWDTMSYTDGVLDYNQDAHRQRTVDWCDSTGGTCAAFDFTTKGILQEAVSRMEYWRLVDAEGRPPGMVGMWPSRAITFLENHDTGSTLQHWPFPTNRLQEGYAYILTHPGTPCIFYDHYYSDDQNLRTAIRSLVKLRKRLRIHAKSKVFVRAARADLYAATINDVLAVKIGPGDWSPNHAPGVPNAGRWKLNVSGHNFAVWVLDG